MVGYYACLQRFYYFCEHLQDNFRRWATRFIGIETFIRIETIIKSINCCSAKVSEKNVSCIMPQPLLSSVFQRGVQTLSLYQSCMICAEESTCNLRSKFMELWILLNLYCLTDDNEFWAKILDCWRPRRYFLLSILILIFHNSEDLQKFWKPVNK